MLTKMLPAESADQLEFLEFATISVDKSSPLIHLVPGFLIEFVLEVVILFLELLRKFPYDIVLELEELSLLLVVIHQHPTLSKLTWQVVREHIDLNLEVLGASIFDVVIQLAILMQELKLVRTKGIQPLGLNLTLRNFILVSAGNLFHGHEDLVNSCDVFLHFGYIVLEYSKLYSFSGSQPLHDCGILVSDIFFNNSFNRFNLI